MIRETIQAILACVITFVVCAVLYPLIVLGVARTAFPDMAEGSLIRNAEGVVIGSELIAQPFVSEAYFHPRPSAVDYRADASGGSNLGTKNPDLRKKVAERAETLKATKENPTPVDLVSASGGGLDPHISREAALYQVARVAAARNMAVDRVTDFVEDHVDRSGAIIGAPGRVNVLRLNLDLDREKPMAPSAPPATAGEKSASSVLTDESLAIHNQVGEITGQVPRPGDKRDSTAKNEATSTCAVPRT